MRRQVFLLSLAMLALAAPAHAQNTFWSFLTPGTTLPRCAESSIAYKDAGARIDLLHDYVELLPDSINASAAVNELHALLKSECFLPAAETGRIPTPDSTLALKRWWFDGGRSWLESYLKLPVQGELQNLRPHVVLPPDARPTLLALLERDNPLRAFVCRLGDERCGAETLGWIQRAEQAFGAHRLANVDNDTRLLQGSIEPIASTSEAASERCTSPDATKLVLDVAMPTKDRGRYQTWRDCLEIHRPKTNALPLGRLKPPTTGWLIVTGRRGHYSFCDSTGAYDLATGAAFVRESCSGLSLVADGTVDRALTDANRTENLRSGRISIDNLREALWMMLLQEHTPRLQIRPKFYPLPEGLTPETIARGETFDSSIYDAVSFSTAMTTLAWRRVPPTGPEINGEMTWPGSFDGAEDHATALLNTAELGLVPGCVPRRAPSASILGLPEVRVNPVDAPSDRSFYRKAENAYKQWARVPLCK